MNGLRVAIITRRFWPLAGHSERSIAQLARELLEQGASPFVVTARFETRWPAEVTFRELPVHRLPFPATPGWGMMRYLIALSRWLRRNGPDIDVAYVSQLSVEAYAALGALSRTGVPVVLRACGEESTGSTRFERWQEWAGRARQRCQSAAAVVTNTGTHRGWLLEAGFDTSRVHVIPDGVVLKAPGNLSKQLNSRAALAAANEDLRVNGTSPVVTRVGPLQAGSGLRVLIDAWRHVVRQYPHARLWLIGDGPQRARLYRRVQDADLVGRVLMPGTFDDLEDVFRASNLLVVSAWAAEQSVTVLEAMAASLPVLVVESREHDNLIVEGVTGRRATGESPRQLADALLAALAQPQRGLAMAEAARAHVAQHHTLREMARQHLQLFSTLVSTASKRIP